MHATTIAAATTMIFQINFHRESKGMQNFKQSNGLAVQKKFKRVPKIASISVTYLSHVAASFSDPARFAHLFRKGDRYVGQDSKQSNERNSESERYFKSIRGSIALPDCRCKDSVRRRVHGRVSIIIRYPAGYGGSRIEIVAVSLFWKSFIVSY